MSAPGEATYTYGYSTTVVNVHGRRSAEREAAFLLPHLRPGLRLLDAGCGPGSITAGLARAVAPGVVIGCDLEPAVLRRARAKHGLVTCAARAESLPFADATFDVVLAHTLLEHVADPPAVIAELLRVLRPGGLLALRDCDWQSGVYAPADPGMDAAIALYDRIWRANGGHPTAGRMLRPWLHAAGCTRIETSTSFRWDGTPAESRDFGELLAARFRLPEFVRPALANGWATAAELEQISAACRSWSGRPDAYAAMIMAEAVAVRT